MHEQEGYEPFQWRLTGGDYAQAQRGTSYHTFQGKAMSQEARDFIRAVHLLHFSATYTIATYGFRNSQVLVREWCHRLEVLRCIFAEVGAARWHAEAAAHMSSPDYTELPEFQDVAATCGENTQQRITQIRRLGDPTYTPSSGSSSSSQS